MFNIHKHISHLIFVLVPECGEYEICNQKIILRSISRQWPFFIDCSYKIKKQRKLYVSFKICLFFRPISALIIPTPLEVSDFLYSNGKYSANLLCIDEFMFLPYNPNYIFVCINSRNWIFTFTSTWDYMEET
jgi:hypothetical protein